MTRRLSAIFLALLWLLSPTAALTPGQQSVLFSGGGANAWIPQLNGVQPVAYADFTTQGTTNHFLVNGAQQVSFATWMTAMGGTFARAGNATYFLKGVLTTAGTNVPRFPTDVSGNPLGIRITAAQQNIVIHSAFDAGFWTAQNVTLTPASVPGPDGNATSAASLIPNTSSGAHNTFLTGFTTYATNTYTIAVFAQNRGYNFLVMDPINVGFAGTTSATYDLTTGAATKQAGVTAAGAIQLANGWWQCWITLPMTTGVRANTYGALPTSTYANYTGDGVSGINLFGVTSVLGTFPPDYVPTTTVAVTQPADDLHTTVTAWFPAGAAQNTVFVDAVIDNPGNASPANAAIWDNGVNQNVEDVRTASTGTNGLVTSGNVIQWTSISGPAALQGVRYKNALALAPSNFAIARNGAIFASQASGILPVGPTRFALGNSSAGVSAVGNFRQFGFWGIRGSNSGIQALTQ